MTKFYIKIVQAFLDWDKEPEFTSLCFDSSYAMRYFPGVWIKPALEHSRLFVFRNMTGAFDFLNIYSTTFRMPRDLPYHGKMLWWCHARDIEYPQQPPLWGPTDRIIEQYWAGYPYLRPQVSHCYQPDLRTHATLYATAIKLVTAVTEEEVTRLLAHGLNQEEK